MFVRLHGGPLDGETVKVSKATQAIEVELGNGMIASYRLTANGSSLYDGIRPMPNSKAVRSAGVGTTTVAAGNKL
jgi:hypothetical protein